MKQRMLIGLVGVIGVLFAAATAQAATVVALGASNTFGNGVSRCQAYPAQLEDLIGARALMLASSTPESMVSPPVERWRD